MNDFVFHTPTKVFFGRGGEKKVGEILRSYGFSKVLFHYGSGSIKRSGLYDTVVASLKDAGISFVELGGVEANPKVSLAWKAAKLAREEKVDLILAVGGGSVLDSSKAAAAGAYYNCDPWEFSTKELTFTVGKFQTGCGIVDIMMHTLERYFSLNGDTPLTDNLDEGLLRTVAEAGKRAIADPEDYEARAALMWAGSLSHNGLTGCGKSFVMRCHQLEHELSGAYDRVAHGAGLSVIFPAWAKYIYQYNVPRFARYAANVWGIPMDFEHPERTALEGIQATEAYFQSIGMPVRLSELDVDDTKFDEMAEKCTFFGKRTLPDYKELGKTEMIDIYRLCL